MKQAKKRPQGKRPATIADVNRAKVNAQKEAIEVIWSILFTVLRDKEGYEIEDLRRVWNEVNDLSDSITKGYVSIDDLRQTLLEEEGIRLVD